MSKLIKGENNFYISMAFFLFRAVYLQQKALRLLEFRLLGLLENQAGNIRDEISKNRLKKPE